MDQTTVSANTTTLNHRLTTFFHAVLFVLGFSLIFVIGWGGAATALGQLFGQYKSTLGQVGGVLVIVFGLATLRILKIPWLYYDTRP
jgi:cytochrome c-type biogenesis protein